MKNVIFLGIYLFVAVFAHAMSDTLSITINNGNGKSFGVEADTSETIYQLKQKIAQQQNIAVEHQRLVAKGRILENEEIVGELRLQQNTHLRLVISLAAAATAKFDAMYNYPANFAEDAVGQLADFTTLASGYNDARRIQATLRDDQYVSDPIVIFAESFASIVRYELPENYLLSLFNKLRAKKDRYTIG